MIAMPSCTSNADTSDYVKNPFESTSSVVKTELVKAENGTWTILQDGEPYFIKGTAAGSRTERVSENTKITKAIRYLYGLGVNTRYTRAHQQ